MLIRLAIILSLFSCRQTSPQLRAHNSQRSQNTISGPSRAVEEGLDSGTQSHNIGAIGNSSSQSASYCKASAVSALNSNGPYSVETKQSGSYTIYYPSNIKGLNCKLPTVSWGNGTGRTGGRAYASLHQFWASHGIVSVVSHSGATGSGKPITEGIDLIERLSKDSSSDFLKSHQDLQSVVKARAV